MKRFAQVALIVGITELVISIGTLIWVCIK